ncbi:MAG: methyltransferase domain-containing protein [Ancrocorticia sp.]
MSATISPLLTPEGRALLSALPAYEQGDVFSLTNRLRGEGYSPELVSLALTQARLRQKAQEKFGDFAASMFFTAAGLEQSTRLSVGVHHAARLREAGARHVVDLGCGIGADSLAMAGLGLRVTSIETDPETAAAAAANLAPFPEAAVLTGDGLEISLEDIGADAIWLDPARRDSTGRRLKNPEEWSPKLSAALDIASHYSAAGIKVAPGIAHGLCPENSHVQWISHDGDLLEAVIWLGAAAPAPGRSSLILRRDQTFIFDSGARRANEELPPVPPAELGEYICEPDPAIIRSGGISRLCAEHGLAPVSAHIAYLSGDCPESSLLTRFKVREVLPLEVKALKKVLKNAGITRLEIKKRGTDTDPEVLRRKLGLRKQPGGKEAVLILTPLMGRHRAVLADRVD